MQSPPKMKVLTDLVNELSDSLGRRELLCASDQILPERTERPIRMLELATASPLLRLRLQIVGPAHQNLRQTGTPAPMVWHRLLVEGEQGGRSGTRRGRMRWRVPLGRHEERHWYRWYVD